MTSTNKRDGGEVELLPCPFCWSNAFSYQQTSKLPDNWAVRCEVCGGQCGPSASSVAAQYNWNTRANVERALAESLAECERLRADRDGWAEQASDRVKDWEQAYNRAERLAGALDAMVRASYAVCTSIDQRGYRWSEAYLDSALPEARAALEQEPQE